MSELTFDPVTTTQNEASAEPVCSAHERQPDPRLVSAAALLLRWLLETQPGAEAGETVQGA